MTEAFLWGAFAASSLVLGGVVALAFHVSGRVLGLILAFGAGVLISAVAYELVEEAFATSKSGQWVAAGLFAGALVYFGGDELIDRRGGDKRKSMGGEQEEGTALAIVLGIVLDGIPESVVIGLTLLEGGSVGVAMLVAVFMSNLPEAIGATSGLAVAGWRRSRILGLWGLVVVSLRPRLPRRLRAPRRRFAERGRLRARVCGRRDPDDARRDDDPGGLPPWWQGGRPGDDARLRRCLRGLDARLSKSLPIGDPRRSTMAAL